MCWLGLLLGFAMPDVLQTVGIKNWLFIVDTKILEIGWMLLKTGAGENLIWTTSSASAGFECKLNFVYIVQFVHISFIFHACAQWGSPFLVCRLDSTRLDSALPTGPTSDNSATKLSNSFPTSMAEHARSRMSSANRRSMRCGMPADKSKRRSPTFNLHFRQTVTRHRKGALKPHPCRTPPCRTPPVMLNVLASTCQSDDLSKLLIV